MKKGKVKPNKAPAQQPVLSSKTAPLKLNVSKPPRYLCFEHCDITNHLPTEKKQVKKVVEALISFADEQKLRARNPHLLSGSGENEQIKHLTHTHGHQLKSLDVGVRGGQLGQYRLVYYVDPIDSSVAKVVALFIDSH